MEYRFEFGVLRNRLPYRVPVDPAGRCHVVDGDTIVVGGERWRLEGIDAPPIFGFSSTKPHCALEGLLGALAKQHLEQLVREAASRQALGVEVLRKREKFGRQMVRIFSDDRSIADMMVEEGLARRYNGRGPKFRFCQCE